MGILPLDSRDLKKTWIYIWPKKTWIYIWCSQFFFPVHIEIPHVDVWDVWLGLLARSFAVPKSAKSFSDFKASARTGAKKNWSHWSRLDQPSTACSTRVTFLRAVTSSKFSRSRRNSRHAFRQVADPGQGKWQGEGKSANSPCNLVVFSWFGCLLPY